MIVFFPLHKITKYQKKRNDHSDRFYCCFRNRAVPCCLWHFSYLKLNSPACIYRLNLVAEKKKIKSTERRAGLRFDCIHEKLNYPKRCTDNTEKKIKDHLLFIKTIGLRPRGAAAVSLFRGICHGNLSSICRVNSVTLYFMLHWFTFRKFIFKFNITGKKAQFSYVWPKHLNEVYVNLLKFLLFPL